MHYLYHGSVVQGLVALEPRKRFTPGEDVAAALIYATPLPGYAAAHAFPWSSDEGFDVAVENERVTLLVPKGCEDRLLVPISIYKLPADTFKLTEEEVTGQTWHSTSSVPVIEETKYPSVRDALVALGVQLKFI